MPEQSSKQILERIRNALKAEYDLDHDGQHAPEWYGGLGLAIDVLTGEINAFNHVATIVQAAAQHVESLCPRPGPYHPAFAALLELSDKFKWVPRRAEAAPAVDILNATNHPREGDNRAVSTERCRSAASVPGTPGSYSRSDLSEDAQTPAGSGIASPVVPLSDGLRRTVGRLVRGVIPCSRDERSRMLEDWRIQLANALHAIPEPIALHQQPDAWMLGVRSPGGPWGPDECDVEVVPDCDGPPDDGKDWIPLYRAAEE